MRTIIDLPNDQLAALEAWRAANGVSRAEAVRRAVARLLDDEPVRRAAILAARGLWADREEDGLAYQKRMRGEWEGQ